MSVQQVEKIKKYFENKRNKERLIELMKQGEYLEFVESLGFIYGVKIGEMEGNNLMLRVAMKNGAFKIMDAYQSVIKGVEKSFA